MVESKRKKHHDKDKYYRLAKEQGLRSRAAFKLTQINRKFPVLEKCTTAVLDLCAAPGGWTQIAARTCPKQVQIIAVDILPIRALTGHQNNVTTLIGDITTDQCKADIKRTIQTKCNPQNSKSSNNGGSIDVVLHDGAPNIGAEYGKDAYEQNEMTLHAIRVATQHLKARTGVFITKVYRSRDYSSLQWVLQQLFDTVTTFKPKASRTQSAEIFIICQGYKCPLKGVDPKLLDPKYVFESIDGETTGGIMGAGTKSMTVFDKNWDKPVRKRGGYDTDHLDFAMRHIESVLDFINAPALKEAIQMLSRSTGLRFVDDDDDTNNELSVYVKNHPFTTVEIKESLADLQVLNKSDFKALLNWRTQMQDSIKAKQDNVDNDDDNNERDGDNDGDEDGNKDNQNDDDDSDKEEEVVQAEIQEMRQRRMKEAKRKLKKERALAAKRRKRSALGMDENAVDITGDQDQMFSLSSIPNSAALANLSEVNLDQMTDEQIFGNPDVDDGDIVIIGKNPDDEDNDSDDNDSGSNGDTNHNNKDNNAIRLLKQRERELNEAYDTYLQTTKDGLAKSGTKMAKRSKKVQRDKVVQEAIEDQEMVLNSDVGLSYDAKAYAKLLSSSSGKKNDDDSSDDDSQPNADDNDDDGYHNDPMTPEEHAAAAMQRKKSGVKGTSTSDKNPLIFQFDDSEPASMKTSRWFSNPLFASIGKVIAETATSDEKTAGKRSSQGVTEDEDESNSDDESDASNVGNNRKHKATKKSKSNKITADDVLALMPKTDKQKRHEKRMKQMEKDKWKEERRARKSGSDVNDGDMQIVPGDHYDSDDDINNKRDFQNLSADRKKKITEARELIKAGMGKIVGTDKSNNDSIEIVPTDDSDRISNRPIPVVDDRKYDSDHEEYDSDDYAETLAIGTMIVRSKTKEKAFVDASYNRYAWNDPDSLPDWFVDDEKKHYRPQLPIPPALLAKMKEKMIALSVKPIKKVAEARARKNKRAKLKLTAAKKKAEALAKSPDMSEAMKLKAISKALQGNSKDGKKPGKQYVVAKKGRATKGAKGVRVVDKRLKCDTRATKRIEKKKKNGGKIPKKRGR